MVTGRGAPHSAFGGAGVIEQGASELAQGTTHDGHFGRAELAAQLQKQARFLRAEAKAAQPTGSRTRTAEPRPPARQVWTGDAAKLLRDRRLVTSVAHDTSLLTLARELSRVARMTTLGAPHALIVSLRNWFGAARLPRAFRRAGFEVSTLAYPNLLLGRSRLLRAQHLLPDQGTDDELIAAARAALSSAAPSIVIPTDDASVELLQAVAERARRELPDGDPLLELLWNSLGDFRKHAVLRTRQGLANLAVELGLRAPAYAVVHDRAQAGEFVKRHGLPVVLKAEESFAGLGVSICRDEPALDVAVERLATSNPRVLAEGALLQQFVPGRTAMRAVVAFRGEVLGGLSAIKVETHPGSTGPSAVVEFIEHPELRATASAMVRALGFSGFASLDFILDDAGAAHLIEMNSRPTPICHLGEYLGLDLCARLKEALQGQISADRDPTGLPKKVALFPQEWVRNASSPHFADAYHDVPWDEPELVEAFVVLARAQMRGGEWRGQETRRERLRQTLGRWDSGA